MVKIHARVDGLKAVEANIQRELMLIKGRTYQGMYAAVKHLEYRMDTESPLVPVSNEKMKVHMRDTFFIGGSNHPTNPVIFAGYTADYAPTVHEGVVGAGHPIVNWTRPGSGPKWLQIHFARNVEQMKLIVAQYVQVRLNSNRSGGKYTNISQRTNERNVEF